MDKIQEVVQNFEKVPGGLLEALHDIQEKYSYIPKEALIQLAKVFDIPLAKAYGVASFYAYFSFKPRGKYIVRVCESTPCQMNGAAELVKALEEELGISMGETTPDGLFTLESTQCVGACEGTPVITINGTPYRDLNRTRIKEILSQYQA